MKLWLDDIRPCPDGHTHARSVNEAIKLLEQHDCTYASLDYDLGDHAEDGGDGFKLVLWMAEHDRWPSEGIRIHSATTPTDQCLIPYSSSLLTPSRSSPPPQTNRSRISTN